MAETTEMDLWLEKMDPERHWSSFYKLWSDEQAGMWSTRQITSDEAANRKHFDEIFIRQPPYVYSLAIMIGPAPSQPGRSQAQPVVRDHSTDAASATSSSSSGEMVGLIRLGGSSPDGPTIGYMLLPEAWGKGYATRALRGFLDWFWSEPRRAPRSAIFAPRQIIVTETESADGQAVAEAAAVAVDAATAAASAQQLVGTVTNEAPQSAELGKGAPNEEEEYDEVEITCILAGIDPDNKASRRVVEKCGGVYVKTDQEAIKLWRFPEKRDVDVFRWDKP